MPENDISSVSAAPDAGPLRLEVPLAAALAMIDRILGIDTLLNDDGKDRTEVYFDQSRMGYERLYNGQGCMHLALNTGRVFDPSGLYSHPKTVEWHLGQLGAKRVLELGCGTGFNTLYLAGRHPDIRFSGLDLLPQHRDLCRSKAREQGVTNADFMAASFESLPETLGGFDVVFGVETLCYTVDLDRVARGIARTLRPGGRFVQFDPFRHEDLSAQPDMMITATRLFEIGAAVTNGFWPMQAWVAALQRAGLDVRREQDLTPGVMPTLIYLQTRAIAVLGDWKKRLALKALPPYLLRNIATAITGPLVYGGPGPLADPARGTLRYGKIVALKPDKSL